MPLTYTDRQALLARRRTEFVPANEACTYSECGPSCPYCKGTKKTNPIDFAPTDGRCFHCRGDLVAHHGEKYPTAYITGCPFCHYSYCE